jgi:hypothetical protein
VEHSQEEKDDFKIELNKSRMSEQVDILVKLIQRVSKGASNFIMD